MSSSQASEGHTSRLVAELADERVNKPEQPIGLLFELVASDRPPVRVHDGLEGEQPWT
jgi:hypothetical protein